MLGVAGAPLFVASVILRGVVSWFTHLLMHEVPVLRDIVFGTWRPEPLDPPETIKSTRIPGVHDTTTPSSAASPT